MTDKVDVLIKKVNEALQSVTETKQPIDKVLKEIEHLLRENGYGRLASVKFELDMCRRNFIDYTKEEL